MSLKLRVKLAPIKRPGKQQGKVLSCSKCSYKTTLWRQFHHHRQECSRSAFPLSSSDGATGSDNGRHLDLNSTSLKRKFTENGIESNDDQNSASSSSQSQAQATVFQRRISNRWRAYIRKYVCKFPNCSYSTTNSFESLMHERNVHDQKDFSIYVCDGPGCGYSSKWPMQILRHRQSVHNLKKPWEKVPYQLPDTSGSSNEVAESVGSESVMESSCNDLPTIGNGSGEGKRRRIDSVEPEGKLTRLEKAENSIRAVGQGKNARFECKLCGYITARRHGMKIHCIIRHFGNKRFQCRYDGCTFVTSSKKDLYKHKSCHKIPEQMKKDNETVLQCGECDYSTQKVYNLNIHKINHEKKNPKFRCKVCSYGANKAGHVKRHEERYHQMTAKKSLNEEKISEVSEEVADSVEAEIVPPVVDKSMEPESRVSAECQVHEEGYVIDNENGEKLAASSVEEAVSEPSVPQAALSAGSSMLPSVGSEVKRIDRRKMSKPHKITIQPGRGKRPKEKKRRRGRFLAREPADQKPYYDRGNGMLRCRFCPYEASRVFTMRSHFSIHSRNQDLSCGLCDFRCKRVRDLFWHQDEVHQGWRPRSDDMDVKDGVSVDAEVDDETETETEADQIQNDPEPQNEVKEARPMNYSDKFSDDELCCKECDYVGKFPSDLQKHLANAHDQNKQFVCTICQRRYRWQQDLTNHLRSAHEGRIAAPKKGGSMRNQRRSSRKRRFSSLRRRNAKASFTEQHVTRLFCRQCDHVANCRTDLIRHAETHTNKVAYHCGTCEYETQWKSDLKRHLEKAHPMVYSSEFVITLFIEKLEDEVIEGVIDHERSVEAFYEAENTEHTDFVDPNDIDLEHSDVFAKIPSDVSNEISAKKEGMDIQSKKPSPRKRKVVRELLDEVKQGKAMAVVMGAEQGGGKLPVEKSPTKGGNVSSDWFTVERNEFGPACVYRCNFCAYVATRKDSIVYHCASHENLKRFLCTLCGRRMNHRVEMNMHVAKNHMVKDMPVSDTAEIVVLLSHDEARSTLDDYLEKRREHRGGLNCGWGALPKTPILPDSCGRAPKRVLKCTECNFSSVDSSKFWAHVKTHPGKSSGAGTAPVAGVSTAGRVTSATALPSGVRYPYLLPKTPTTQSDSSSTAKSGESNPSWSQGDPGCDDKTSDVARRFKCSLCSFRSNSYSETGRHIEKLHPCTRVARVEVLPLDVALSSLQAYEQAFHGKEPVKDIKAEEKTTNSNFVPLTPKPPTVSEPDEKTSNLWIWKCPKCDYRKLEFSDVQAHFLREHVESMVDRFGNIQYGCRICPYTADRRSRIFKHLTDSHSMLQNLEDFTIDPVKDKRLLRPILVPQGSPSPPAKVPQTSGSLLLNNPITGSKVNEELKAAEPNGKSDNPSSVPAMGYVNSAPKIPVNVPNLPKGTRIYRCSICSFMTPFLNFIETHIATTHADRLSKVKAGLPEEGITITKRNDASDTANSAASLSTNSGLLPAPSSSSGGMVYPLSKQPSPMLASTPHLSPVIISPQKGNKALTPVLNTSQLIVNPSQKSYQTTGILLSPSMPKMTSPNVSVSTLPSSSISKPTTSVASTSAKLVPVAESKEQNDGILSHFKMKKPRKKQASEGGDAEPLGDDDEITYLVSPDGRVYSCTICPYRTRGFSKLVSHMRHHQPNMFRKCKCPFCPYWVRKAALLHKHMNQHKKAKNSPVDSTMQKVRLKPQLLDGTANSASNTKSSVEMGFCLCEYCPYYSFSRTELQNHKLYHHDGFGVKCAQCTYRVSNPDHMIEHFTVHSPQHVADRQRLIEQFKSGLLLRLAQNGNAAIPAKPSSGMTLHHKAKTAGQKMISPSKEDAGTYDPVAVSYLKNDIVSSKVSPSVLRVLPTDDDLVETPIETRNKDNVDVILYKHRQALDKRLCLTRCRYCPYSHIKADVLRRHERLHGVELDKSGVSKDKLMKCRFCDYYSSRVARQDRHEKVHSLSYTPDINDTGEVLYGYNDVNEDESGQKEPVLEDLSAIETGENIIPVSVSALAAPPFQVQFNQTRGEHIVRCTLPVKLTCERCPYGTTDRQQFERHIYLHGSKQDFTCLYCDYSVSTKPMLNLHSKLHLKPNSNLLQVQSLNNLNTLSSIPADYAIVHHVSENDSSGLHGDLPLYENSERKEKGAKEKTTMACEKCPFTTTGILWYNKHKACHGAEAQWTCPYCDFGCTMQKVLNTHIRLHFVPTNADGSRPKYKEVFVKSHLIDNSELDNGEGEQNEIEKDTEKAVTSAVEALEKSENIVPLNEKEKEGSACEEKKKSGKDDGIAMVSVEKNLAEFAASAMVLSPDLKKKVKEAVKTGISTSEEGQTTVVKTEEQDVAQIEMDTTKDNNKIDKEMDDKKDNNEVDQEKDDKKDNNEIDKEMVDKNSSGKDDEEKRSDENSESVDKVSSEELQDPLVDKPASDVGENSCSSGDKTDSKRHSSDAPTKIVSEIPLPLQVDEPRPRLESGASSAPREAAPSPSSCICPFCDRAFSKLHLLQKHQTRHLIGNHYN